VGRKKTKFRKGKGTPGSPSVPKWEREGKYGQQLPRLFRQKKKRKIQRRKKRSEHALSLRVKKKKKSQWQGPATCPKKRVWKEEANSPKEKEGRLAIQSTIGKTSVVILTEGGEIGGERLPPFLPSGAREEKNRGKETSQPQAYILL